jgi:hypothetical protein
MDSRTHVELSRRLVAAAGGPEGAAIAALFPQVDRHPPTLHRLHAHNVHRARPIVRLGLALLSGGRPPEQADPYERERFESEAPRFKDYLREPLGAAPPAEGPEATEAALMAFVSHLYLDTFNQPVQPFAPTSVYCAGQWELWQALGDFRKRLYTTGLIDSLRDRLFAEGVWADLGGLSAPALTEGMLVRLCALSRGDLPASLAETSMEVIGLRRDAPARVRAAVELLTLAEERIRAHHLQCLQTGEAAVAPR